MRLQDVVAGDRRAIAITASDITTLPARTNLLGVASDTAERNVDITTLDRESRDGCRIERAAFFLGGRGKIAKLHLRAKEQSSEGQRDGQKDAGNEKFWVRHGGAD
jgi:hypothetical protein